MNKAKEFMIICKSKWKIYVEKRELKAKITINKKKYYYNFDV
jgi:hypothetical protein